MPPSDPTVTIVITTYNHARFLGEAIASVKAQRAPVAEIIVVDDGSSDDPEAVVRQHPGVTLIHQANQGLAAARNTGLRAASGTYVGFLDADDILMPNMVAANLAQFTRRPDCGFVYGAYALVDADRHLLAEVPLRETGPDAYASFLSGNVVGMHGTVLYRRDLLQEEGGFDASLRAVEDHDMYLRLARKHPVCATSERLAEYRRHDSNMSNNVPNMLATALAVQGRHRQLAASRPEWREAYRRGTAEWQAHYSGEQVNRLGQAWRARSDLPHVIGGTARVAFLAPRAMGRHLRAKLRRRLRGGERPPIRFGDLHRTSPVSTEFGFDRGKPVDRRYVEAFLAAHAGDIRGRVLEIGDSAYTRRFGGDRVERAEVLNRYEGHPETTYVGDLIDGSVLPSDAFDCIVLTQTLHLLYDMPAAVATLWRTLKPGGVLLVTVPWVSPIDRGEWGDDWFWSVSPNALRRLLSGPFSTDMTDVRSYGNVLSATAFLFGLAEHEVSPTELDVHDPHCPVIVAGRAVKDGPAA
jgi:glycosyltransferase involved in cell wall biosynthesis